MCARRVERKCARTCGPMREGVFAAVDAREESESGCERFGSAKVRGPERGRGGQRKQQPQLPIPAQCTLECGSRLKLWFAGETGEGFVHGS